MTRLTDAQRAEIIGKAHKGQSRASLGREYDVSPKTISRLLAATEAKGRAADPAGTGPRDQERDPVQHPPSPSPQQRMAAEHAEIDAQMQMGLDRVAADSKRRSALAVDIGSYLVVQWGATARTYELSPHELARHALDLWSRWRRGVQPLRDAMRVEECRAAQVLARLDESYDQVLAISRPMKSIRKAFETWCLADAMGHRIGVEDTRAALNGDSGYVINRMVKE